MAAKCATAGPMSGVGALWDVLNKSFKGSHSSRVRCWNYFVRGLGCEYGMSSRVKVTGRFLAYNLVIAHILDLNRLFHAVSICSWI